MTINPTPNFRLSRPKFNESAWHDEVNGNTTVIDALFKAMGLANVTGAWTTGTLYTIGERVVDPITGITRQAAVTHTSGLTTQAADIAAHPTWWAVVSSGVVVREAFATGVVYNIGDFVYQTSEYLAGIVETGFTGGATLRTNIANLGVIYDIKTAMTSITAAVADAEADKVQTGLDRIATAADRVQTGQDKIATAADRVQTGQDRTAAAASALQAVNVVGAGTLGAIRHDVVQTLSATQQGQAKGNIGADILGEFRNKVINGRFLVNERNFGTLSGTIAPSATANISDKWSIQNTTNQTLSWSIASSLPYNRNEEENRLALSFAVAPTTGDVYIIQQMEDVRTLAGRAVTTMCRILDLGILAASGFVSYFTQNFGTGGSTQVGTGLAALTMALGSSRALITLAPVSGKTIGAGNSLNAVWRFTPRTTGLTVLTEFGVVEGDARAEDNPYSPRHIKQERDLCGHYFRVIGVSNGANNDWLGTGIARSTTLANIHIPIRGRMRTIPTVSLGGSFNVTDAVAAALAVTAISAVNIGMDAVGLSITVASGLVAGNGTILLAATNAARIILDADV